MQQRFLLQILLLAQHVSGTTLPIIRSSRVLYSGCCLWYFVLWFLSWWSGVELRVMCPVCRMLQHPTNQAHWCPKHVEQAIRSAIKTSVASSWHSISTYYTIFVFLLVLCNSFWLVFIYFVFYFPLSQLPASHKIIRMESLLELIEFTGALIYVAQQQCLCPPQWYAVHSSGLFPVSSHFCCTKHIVVQKTWISHYFFAMLGSGKI
jgi:hypothetical protein